MGLQRSEIMGFRRSEINAARNSALKFLRPGNLNITGALCRPSVLRRAAPQTPRTIT
jgi:hypothetical protein